MNTSLRAGTGRLARLPDGNLFPMTGIDPSKDLDDLIHGGSVVMLMTMIGDEHSSRPMTVAGVDGGRVEMLVDKTVDWVAALDRPGTVVHASVSDERKNVYLSLNGKASVVTDEADIERLWNPGGAAYFDGKDDPTLGVLRFDVSRGDYWDSPSGRIGSAISMLKVKITGDQQAAGEHGSVTTG